MAFLSVERMAAVWPCRQKKTRPDLAHPGRVNSSSIWLWSSRAITCVIALARTDVLSQTKDCLHMIISWTLPSERLESLERR